jgi:hypothetical protein
MLHLFDIWHRRHTDFLIMPTVKFFEILQISDDDGVSRLEPLLFGVCSLCSAV